MWALPANLICLIFTFLPSLILKVIVPRPVALSRAIV